MNPRSTIVSIHPYFKVQAGKLSEAKALFPRFIAATAPDPGCLYYDFTVKDDVVFCREAYVSAEALLGHVEKVGVVLGEMLAISEIMRLEVHGGAAELDKLRGPLAAMNPDFYVFEAGAAR